MGKKKRPPLPVLTEAVVDTHCHLDPEAYGGDEAAVEGLIEGARAAGVEAMIAIGAGYGIGSARRAVRLAERRAGVVWCSVGLHPHDAALWTDEVEAELRELAASPRVVALGEMGLDFHYDFAPPGVQETVLRRQAALAVELGLPIIVHDRDTEGRTLAVLDELAVFDAVPVVFHCFSGDVAMMGELVERGASISVGGVVTYKKAETLREVVRRVPADHLMLETDSPYLTPLPMRGRRNQPAYVLFSLVEMAQLRRVHPDELARQTRATTYRFFRRMAAGARI